MIFAGLPFAAKTVEVRWLEREYRKRLGHEIGRSIIEELPIIVSLVQGANKLSQEEKGVIVVLDSRLRKMKGQPLEMKEKEKIEEVREEVGEFYRKSN